MKYTPVLVGAAVGAGDAVVSKIPTLQKHEYAHGIYKFGILALGAAGEMFFNWNPNISYGMMTAASTLIGARVPYMFESGNGGIKAIATYTEPAQQPPTAAGKTAAGCSACGKLAAQKHMHAVAAPLAVPKLDNDWRPREQPVTGAG